MFNFKNKKESFDLIWCEGAIFIIGLEKGLTEWRPLLKKDGYIVFSELSWLRVDGPEEIKSYIKGMYGGLKNSGKKS